MEVGSFRHGRRNRRCRDSDCTGGDGVVVIENYRRSVDALILLLILSSTVLGAVDVDQEAEKESGVSGVGDIAGSTQISDDVIDVSGRFTPP